MQVATGGAAWPHSLNQSLVASEHAKVHSAPPPAGSSSHPPGVFPSPGSFWPTKHDFLLSLKLPEGPLDAAPEVWRRTLLAEEGNGHFGAPPFPLYLLGASGVRSKGPSWEDEQDL